MIKLKFKRWKCIIVKGKYRNGRLALELVSDDVRREPVAVATVNIPDEPIEENEVLIKNYSENAGILEVLIRNKIVSEPKRFVSSGFVNIPVCDLLININEIDDM